MGNEPGTASWVTKTGVTVGDIRAAIDGLPDGAIVAIQEEAGTSSDDMMSVDLIKIYRFDAVLVVAVKVVSLEDDEDEMDEDEDETETGS